jgi:hypothetical protein
MDVANLVPAERGVRCAGTQLNHGFIGAPTW